MNDLSKFVKDNAEVIKAEMVCRVWLLVEAIHYHPKNSKESAKITRPAHLWLLDGLSYLTLEDLNYLYSLLVHTRKTKLTSNKDTRISQLLSKLSDINTVHFSGTSQYQNFKSVEPFISTLCSGGYPRLSLKPSEIPDWLLNLGSRLCRHHNH